jgi:2-dehydropantoate 2-reductase
MIPMRKNQVASASRCTSSVLFMVNTASGPGEWVEAVGRERLLLGFPGAGGAKEGHVIHYHVLSSLVQATMLGELDGQSTPRLREIARAFRTAGFPVSVSRNLDAWLKTHVAVVSPIANAFYLAGGDNYRLSKMPEGVGLLVRAIREGFEVVRALGYPITPTNLRVLEWIPEPVLVGVLKRVFGARTTELVMARHANAARDEMRHLADEFRDLCQAASVPTPAIDLLYAYV